MDHLIADNRALNLPNSGILGESEDSDSSDSNEEGGESEESEDRLSSEVDGVPWYLYDGEANAQKGICIPEQLPELISEM